MVYGLYHTVTAAFIKTQVVKEHLLLLVCIKFGNVGLCLGADNNHPGILALYGLPDSFGKFVTCCCTGIVYIAYI